jgi:Protein kinase C terminal domain
MLREMMPPWEPTVVGSLDTSQFDREFTSMPIFSPSDKGIYRLFAISYHASYHCVHRL